MLPELPERDLNHYSSGQLKHIRRTQSIVDSTFHPINLIELGVVVSKERGRFGYIWSLWVDGFNWMNTNPIDYLDHEVITTFHGKVLLTGLGLGLGVLLAARNPKVDSITVIERDLRLLDSVGSVIMLDCLLRKPLEFVVGDADKRRIIMPRYDCAYLDHHESYVPTNVVEMYEETCDRVVTWREEFERITNRWQ